MGEGGGGTGQKEMLDCDAVATELLAIMKKVTLQSFPHQRLWPGPSYLLHRLVNGCHWWWPLENKYKLESRVVSGEGISCESARAKIPGSLGNEYPHLEGGVW